MRRRTGFHSSFIAVFSYHLSLITYHFTAPHVQKNLHRAAADHSLFGRVFGREAEAVERGAARTQSLACLCPDLRLDAAAADRARRRAALEEEHLRAATLRRGAAR